ncbi:MAG TPA: hypothetical protein VJB08_07280 [Candidatus Nanoarchaeia archaeon]|nr:hypothetical protein [Candidatus Nanoarchaeia archaeon]
MLLSIAADSGDAKTSTQRAQMNRFLCPPTGADTIEESLLFIEESIPLMKKPRG